MKFSVIIPVLNEERLIDQSLVHVRESCQSLSPEMIVVDGGSRDRTREIAATYADLVLQSGRPGRAAQMHVGAHAAKGEVLLFLHADTRLPEAWDVTLWKAWSARPQPGATAFRLSYDSDRLIYRSLARLAFWRSRFNGVPHGDQAIAVARETYFAVGGFPEVPLMEEYYLIPKLRRCGPIVILPKPIRTSVRRYETNGPLFNAARNVTLIFLYYMGVSPKRLAAFYGASGRRFCGLTDHRAPTAR